MEEKLTIWISGDIRSSFNHQIKVTQEEYDYLMNGDCDWSDITEVKRDGSLEEAWDIILNRIDLNDSYIDELSINDIVLEEDD